MIAETYICALSNGLFECGYCFKLCEGSEDSEFDIALRVVRDIDEVDAIFADFKPTADRIAAALTDPKESQEA